MSQILENLNQAQLDAVTNFDCASLIVAGAGSGKTRVLTSRIAYMLEKGVAAHRILALTFTNKAAREMRERIGKMVSKDMADRLWMGTFHSIFLRILRYEADRIGYPSSFTIYDTADSRNVVKAIIKEMGLPDDIYKPNAVLSRISLAKNNLVTAAAYEANTAYVTEDRQRKMPEFAAIYKAYARKCRENGAMDFDDMLLNINILFKDHPDVLAKYQERFLYILVDEYQDTNYAQYIIIRRLAEKHSRVCVVGDDAQSIYSFRGAKIENILRFRNDFPEAKTFKLEQNYRSTQNIVNAANSVIEKNRNRIDKSSFSAGDTGEKIKVIKAYTDQEEAALVAAQLRDYVRDSGLGWSEVALLYRTNMQSRVFEEAFRRRGIPYRIYGGMSFYQRKEIKDLLAYMHLIVNPRDDEAFRRVINYPSRGIGDVTVGRIMAAAAGNGLSALEFITKGDLKTAGLNTGAEKKVRDFAELINGLSADRDRRDLYEFGLDVATRSGIIGTLKVEQTPESQSALDNIEELINSIKLFAEDMAAELEYDPMTGEPLEGVQAAPSIVDWLQSVTLLTDMDGDKNADNEKVTLMTVHAAKGLEFKYVFVVGLEENLFPSLMSMDGGEGLEEERRLFYVALTRAKEVAVLSFSETRFKWGSMEFCRPSRFLSEIDPEYLDIAFELEEGSGEMKTAIDRIKQNYEAHNQRAARSAAGNYGSRGDSTSGYGNGNTIRGAEANRFRAAGQVGRGSGQNAAGSRPVEVPAPKVGLGTNFKSIGSRPVAHTELRSATDSPREIPASGNYEVGQRVEHSKFGQGVIAEIERLGGDRKITVDFDGAGRKTLLAKFAKLAVIG